MGVGWGITVITAPLQVALSISVIYGRHMERIGVEMKIQLGEDLGLSPLGKVGKCLPLMDFPSIHF